MKLFSVVSTAVMFTTTADTPVLGTPPRPVTCRVMVPDGPMGAATPVPVPSRVSSRRAGDSGHQVTRGGRGRDVEPAGQVDHQVDGADER